MHLKIESDNIKCDKIYSKNHLDLFFSPRTGFMRFAIDINYPFRRYLLLTDKITKKVTVFSQKKRKDVNILSFEVLVNSFI